MGYPYLENQWLFENNIIESKNLINLFYRLYLKKPKDDEKRKTAKKLLILPLQPIVKL